MDNFETYILKVNESLDKLQQLIETNHKDYTDQSFQKIKSAFEELKIHMLNEVEGITKDQKFEKKLSEKELQRLIDKIESLENNDYITKDKFESLMARRFSKKMLEWGVIIVFLLLMIVGGIKAFFILQGDFNAHIQVSEQNKINIENTANDIKRDNGKIEIRLDNHFKNHK